MNKWCIRGFTALGAGLVGTYLVMAQGRRVRAQTVADEAKKNTKWKRGQQTGDEDLSWTEKVKSAGEKVKTASERVKKNVEDSVQSDSIQDRLRILALG